jgi:hypothetical protein
MSVNCLEFLLQFYFPESISKFVSRLFVICSSTVGFCALMKWELDRQGQNRSSCLLVQNLLYSMKCGFFYILVSTTSSQYAQTYSNNHSYYSSKSKLCNCLKILYMNN